MKISAAELPQNNRTVVAALREAASLLEQHDAGHFRVPAYLKAADAIEDFNEDVGAVARRGMAALEALPHVGANVAAVIHEIVTTGRWAQLERIRGAAVPEHLFQTVPGLGSELSHRIHDRLHVDTLEALEAAAHDGRLTKVPGVGPPRAAVIRATLAERLARYRPAAPRRSDNVVPPIDLLLGVDRKYLERAAAGTLRLIASKRLNPEGKAWLLILRTERGSWHFTALSSNTARTHELKKTNDWVVIFYSNDNQPEGQCTVVSETSGKFKGRRVVRGRKQECALIWKSRTAREGELTSISDTHAAEPPKFDRPEG